MSSTPPPVQTPGSPCPNCGAYRPSSQIYCAACGYRGDGQGATRQTPIVWIVLFIIFGLPAGCLGGCFLALSGVPNQQDSVFTGLIGLVGILVFIALLAMMIRGFKKR
ncbi:MAG: hypothetical protein BGO01_08225 [Armatimonadetes bacterium 55-13]|nr:hypothetical protein [Armatimonadota bacterium]OJU62458.1 MAG: hypothetical protein BGO01_08225 [Armatimonadetes bacterium 55-13]